MVSSSNSSTVNYCGGAYTWSYNGQTYLGAGTYTQTSVNAAGCPHTETLTLINRTEYSGHDASYINTSVKKDTVCYGTTTYSYIDTLCYEPFRGSPSWSTTSSYGTTNWVRAQYLSNAGNAKVTTAANLKVNTSANSSTTAYYYTHTGTSSGSNRGTSASDNGFMLLQSPVSTSYCANAGYAWSNAFNVVNPANVTITYYYFKTGMSTNSGCYRGNYDVFSGWILPANSPGNTSLGSLPSPGDAAYRMFNSGNTARVNYWTRLSVTMSSYINTSGQYRLGWLYQDLMGGGAGVDDILVTESKTFNLSGRVAGTVVTDGTGTNTYGCPTGVGHEVFIMPTPRTVDVEACGSYRWRGTNYTATGVYTKNRTAGQCSASETLNLTIGPSSGTTYEHTAMMQYNWPTSGVNGHGTGLTYTESGTYYGVYYMKDGCQVRDVLNLTIENTCAGLRSMQTVCENYTWPTSGSKGRGTGDTYTVSGTYYGPAYNTDICSNLVDTLDLTVIGNVSENFYITACDNYRWDANGINYTSVPATAPSVTLTNAAGCDSIVTLRLTMASSTSNTTTPSYCGGNYTWSVNSQTYTTAGTYTYNSVNVAGCPHTETLVLIDGNQYNVTRDTVCETESYLITYDTIWKQNFDGDDVEEEDWFVWQMCNGDYTWNFYGECYGYPPYNNSAGQLAAEAHGYTCYDPNDGECLYCTSSQRGSSVDILWGPEFYLSDPDNTTVEFQYQNPAWSGTYDYMYVWIVPTSDYGNVNISVGTRILTVNYSQENWRKHTFTLTGLSAGRYRLKFAHQDNDGDHVAIDDIIVYHRTITDLSSYEGGQTIESVTRTPLPNGCERITGSMTYIQPTGTITTISACDSYTWRDNGVTVDTYTESGTYTHSYTVNGCLVTNTLVLTINTPTFTTYRYTASSGYNWPASGVFGHGTGQTYTTSGTYVGPYFTDSHGCLSRDMLKLTITSPN